MPELLWQPTEERSRSTRLHAFMQWAQGRLGREFNAYSDLHEWSVTEPAEFWAHYLRFSRLPVRGHWEQVVSEGHMSGVRWFEGATVNYAEALLFPQDLEDPDQVALIGVTEEGEEERLTYRELRELVARIQAALAREGIGSGDRVAAFGANSAHTVALLLACAGMGVIFSSCSPDFGLEAAVARFGQVEPRLLFATTAYRYGGKEFDVSGVAGQLGERLGGIPVVRFPDGTGAGAGSSAGLAGWEEWLGDGEAQLRLEPLPFDHPLYILYSSGTTGAPKAMVHRAGGALLSHHKEHELHCDIRAGDTVFYYTTCGWMMWNWMVSALARSATLVLYDGSPVHPGPERLWQLVEQYGVTFLGTSARYLHTLQAQGFEASQHDLGTLRTIASTGSPLSPGGFRYVYGKVKEDVHLASISGGTDIVSCFMLGVPTEPVYAGEIQAAGLGVDLAAFDEEGRPLQGRPGELVCRQPLPSMPLHFWNDEGGERYRSAYFEKYPGVWHHGDLIEITPTGIVVYGRSDATLNPGGVRIGTAEIYAPLDSLPQINEAVAVGRKTGDDEEIWLFVVLAGGQELTEELSGEIRRTIRQAASPRHVPRRILAVNQLPRTRSGKTMELAVARIVNGQPVEARSVIANPESLDEIAGALAGAGVSS